MDVIAEKAELRRNLRKRRAALVPADIDALSDRIAERLEAWPVFQQARTVFCYLGVAHEVRTARIVELCRSDGKSFCVPAWDPEACVYGSARYVGMETLVEGPLRIPQPARPEWVPIQSMDLALIPGLAFDQHGGRIGQGGGHYDRLLASVAETEPPAGPVRVGLAFSFQVLERVPIEVRDVSVHFVVTENEIINTTHQGSSEQR
jgi:5-formyltetrahydrofolate cyclo-ligase